MLEQQSSRSSATSTVASVSRYNSICAAGACRCDRHKKYHHASGVLDASSGHASSAAFATSVAVSGTTSGACSEAPATTFGGARMLFQALAAFAGLSTPVGLSSFSNVTINSLPLIVHSRL